MQRNFILTLIFFCLITIQSIAQKPNEKYQYNIHSATSSLNIDGVADDLAWESAETANNFFMITPMDTSFSRAQTDVKMCYDKDNIYILVINYKTVKGSIIVESLKRDFAFGKNDNFLLFMDTFDDKTNGFSFGANAAGAPWDGQQGDGGTVDLSWDNKWVSAVKNDDDKWVWEAAIPFKSIRYKPGITKWGINFSRQDLTISEKSAWAPVPRQFPSASLAYTGVLAWDVPPPNPGPNISVIPYFANRLTKDYQKDTPSKYKPAVGGDVKIGLTPALNLDLTVNPDFSQVDVDVQQTNLDRFELFFPERRQFFLENADLFANFGYATIRPFFSRRIGLGVPIQFGARMSGKLNKNWRIGVLDVQTGSSDSLTPRNNYAVFALQRQLLARSNVRFIFVNKDATNYSLENHGATNRYNRNIGAEFNLASAKNLWTGKVMMLKSFTPGKTTDDFTHAADLKFNKANFFWQWQHEYVGKNFNAEVGYVPNAVRMGYYKISPNVGYLFFVKNPKIISHGPKLISNVFWDKRFNLSDREFILSYNLNFINRATVAVWGSSNYIRLLRPFDPTNLGIGTLITGSEHNWKAAGFDIVSGPQNRLTYTASGIFGGYYQNGHRNNLRAELGYRVQPYVAITMAGNYNDIRLPEPWKRTQLWLVGPRVDVTFTNKLFFTTFMQYNNQADNINLNARLQWRYKPASDLFIVYTDNYLPENFLVKNRALVLKFTYWWNL
ncbi:DUF5916 domain-containing protein [Dyadobacter sp. CY326]|uniref:DUF5916 domain-containing protein n=1 Tax=Dyadobacter sp. CY326 TaxID=2907300 RepID=UPI001F2FF658|nr:DUF5916 domain-containing protein [Dyadobacter sp. CY326]MCE7066807.1 carbohydrate binding family 9 domain-containing protein [Dyadobacter sp. CY326]